MNSNLPNEDIGFIEICASNLKASGFKTTTTTKKKDFQLIFGIEMSEH